MVIGSPRNTPFRLLVGVHRIPLNYIINLSYRESMSSPDIELRHSLLPPMVYIWRSYGNGVGVNGRVDGSIFVPVALQLPT